MGGGVLELIEEGLDMTSISLKDDPVRSSGLFPTEEIPLDTSFKLRLK